MNYGPLSGPRDDSHWECEAKACGERIYEESDIAGACNAPGCYRTVLCAGCAFDCADCGETFCREHILAHEHAGGTATYLCEACDRKQQAQEVAA